MIAARKPRRDGKRLAVIRKYELTRIECELLARVFDVVAHGAHVHPSESDPEKAMMDGHAGRLADGRSCVGVGANSVAAQLEQREPAA
ncbi:MAG: hypothetical protein KDB27_09605 [Planctomycetales bacterium]|nr:hypothetical protein [Planctomycetales bacterium]